MYVKRNYTDDKDMFQTTLNFQSGKCRNGKTVFEKPMIRTFNFCYSKGLDM